ncbi:M15 family metallopeptidase [Aquipuribacter hungaricus]|uniref:M15 family metallopeptidase n=1 Tax=Aquipuribacter hungaricus TaxID=545624 RepID=A0ABV7WEX1_9MICO
MAGALVALAVVGAVVLAVPGAVPGWPGAGDGVRAVLRDGAAGLPGGTGVRADGAGDARADGRVGDDGLTLDDDSHPAVSGLDPALLSAARAAADAAAADGVRFRLTSGWRSTAYQQHLLDRAVAEHGSYEEARRWVSTPELSAHVTGDAVDIGPTDAAYWLAEHGAQFGLCQVYANEVWHYELLTAPGGQCPALRADGSVAAP